MQDPTKQYYEHLAFSKNANRLLTVSGYPDYVLDIWSINDQKCLARVPLRSRLYALGAQFFPFNDNVLVAVGECAVRLVYLESVLETHVVRQVR